MVSRQKITNLLESCHIQSNPAVMDMIILKFYFWLEFLERVFLISAALCPVLTTVINNYQLYAGIIKEPILEDTQMFLCSQVWLTSMQPFLHLIHKPRATT